MEKLLMIITCTSAAAHFGGLVDALEQFKRHHPMRHVQSFSRSQWMLPSGNYSLHIALVAARATANKTTMKKCNNFVGHFNGCGSVRV
jgi:hypothetical protein